MKRQPSQAPIEPLGGATPAATAAVEVRSEPGSRAEIIDATAEPPEFELIRAATLLRDRQAPANRVSWASVADPGRVEPGDAAASAPDPAPKLRVDGPTDKAAMDTGSVVVIATAEPEARPQPDATPVALAAAADGPMHSLPPHGIELGFARDSSELGPEAEMQLQTMQAALGRDAVWEVELHAAVDDTAGALPADWALAYNQWLADQRQIRVEDWLGSRGDGPVMRIRRSLLPHNPSRRVVVKARQAP